MGSTTSGWRRATRALTIRNYRLFWSGHAVSVIGTWMQRVAQDWLVLELTDSPVAVGNALALQFAPTLFFGLWGGVLVDRLNRRRLIIATQVASAILAGILAGVVLAGLVEMWMVYALALALGFVTMLDTPARQAFVAELVGPDHYVNGLALAATVHNAGRLVGPAVAGVLIAAIGPGWAFAINALSFVAVVWGLILIDPAKLQRAPAAEPASGQIREGLRFVFQSRELRSCLLLVGVVALLGQNFRVTFPLLARDVFHGGPEVYGWLTAALGLGAVVGAFFTAARDKATLVALATAVAAFGVTNIGAGFVPVLWSALLITFAMGWANITLNTLARTLMQQGTDPGMHGRVMSLYGLVYLGTTPLGGPLLGWICDLAGARAGFLVAGVSAVVAGALLLVLGRPRSRTGGSQLAPSAAAGGPS